MRQSGTDVHPTTLRIDLLNEGHKEWTDRWSLPHPTDPLFYHDNPRQDNVNKATRSDDDNDDADADDTKHNDDRRRKPRHSERGTDDDRRPEGPNIRDHSNAQLQSLLDAMRVGTGAEPQRGHVPKAREITGDD